MTSTSPMRVAFRSNAMRVREVIALSKIPAVTGDQWRARKEHQTECDSACTPRVFVDRTVKGLLVLAEEEVVGRVGHELSLTHRAGGGRNSSAAGVQTLDEGGFGQEVAAGWPFLVPD